MSKFKRWAWCRNWLVCDGRLVLTYTTDDDGIYAREPDKRLIAAAPEMYDLLSQLIKENEMDRIAGIMAMAEDLIKRIDGDS